MCVCLYTDAKTHYCGGVMFMIGAWIMHDAVYIHSIMCSDFHHGYVLLSYITITVLTHALPLFSLSLSQRSDALEQLQRELEALKNRLRGEEENRQRDHDASQAAKDAIIDQLRRELHDTQARLNEAENKIVELTTSKAAEIVS